jgi:hypothetical protein
MNIPPKRLIVASVQGILKTLERTPAPEKKHMVSLQLAMDFNATLRSVAEHFPAIAQAIPKPLETRGPATHAGKAPASFLDLEIACEQVLNLIGMVGD